MSLAPIRASDALKKKLTKKKLTLASARARIGLRAGTTGAGCGFEKRRIEG